MLVSKKRMAEAERKIAEQSQKIAGLQNDVNDLVLLISMDKRLGKEWKRITNG